VRLDDFDLPHERTLLVRESRWLGRSVQVVMQRAMKTRSGRGRSRRRLQSLHLLLGIVAPDLGTVPRALAAIGVDRGALIADARASLERAA
jgi:hypothetical protein